MSTAVELRRQLEQVLQDYRSANDDDQRDSAFMEGTIVLGQAVLSIAVSLEQLAERP